MNKESCFTVFLFSSIQVFPAPIVWLLYLLQCWFSPRTPKGKYGCYYGLNTGRRHETMPLLLPRTLIHWKQLCRMGRQWVIPTSNRTSLAPKRHPKCIMLNLDSNILRREQLSKEDWSRSLSRQWSFQELLGTQPQHPSITTTKEFNIPLCAILSLVFGINYSLNTIYQHPCLLKLSTEVGNK